MKARVPAALARRLSAAQQSISEAGVGVISSAQATLASWPPVLELDEWEVLASEQQDALINLDSEPSSWTLVIERDVMSFFSAVPSHLWPQVQIPARGPGSRLGLKILRPICQRGAI